jgi:asparagine synthase (glutamine-hydrolysing)
LKSWLLSPEAAGLYEYLLEENGFLAGFLNLGWLQGLLDQHRSGSVDATDRIWRLLTVQVWGDWYFTGRKGTIEQGLPGFPRS